MIIEINEQQFDTLYHQLTSGSPATCDATDSLSVATITRNAITIAKHVETGTHWILQTPDDSDPTPEHIEQLIEFTHHTGHASV